jgi:hypothetical protein
MHNLHLYIADRILSNNTHFLLILQSTISTLYKLILYRIIQNNALRKKSVPNFAHTSNFAQRVIFADKL